ncbi:hypothetical protein FQR65_LT07547 [Abscondita terminalis]|nr:hypothetical protein FQR65_LT07547 [Abscondita terminalis]
MLLLTIIWSTLLQRAVFSYDTDSIMFPDDYNAKANNEHNHDHQLSHENFQHSPEFHRHHPELPYPHNSNFHHNHHYHHHHEEDPGHNHHIEGPSKSYDTSKNLSSVEKQVCNLFRYKFETVAVMHSDVAQDIGKIFFGYFMWNGI